MNIPHAHRLPPAHAVGAPLAAPAFDLPCNNDNNDDNNNDNCGRGKQRPYGYLQNRFILQSSPGPRGGVECCDRR